MALDVNVKLFSGRWSECNDREHLHVEPGNAMKPVVY